METGKKIGRSFSDLGGYFRRFFAIVMRWFYLFMVIVSVVYAAVIWKRYILSSDWSEEKKNQYIKEQTVLSFDEDKYQKTLGIMNNRREKLENPEKYSGKDIFFPEGF